MTRAEKLTIGIGLAGLVLAYVQWKRPATTIAAPWVPGTGWGSDARDIGFSTALPVSPQPIDPSLATNYLGLPSGPIDDGDTLSGALMI